MKQIDFFESGRRLQMLEAIELTIQSLQFHGPQHDHWGLAYSGGKDSSATLTLVWHLLQTGQIEKPKSLTVFYSDTRLELQPLAIAAQIIIAQLRATGVRVRVVMAPLDKRFMVYILGRGVPPPNNNTFRWCTRQIKVDPMTAAIEEEISALDGSYLMLTGVRLGESAIRDRRIELSCSKDGAECGQGWYQKVLPNAKGLRGRLATLSPLLHWRVCHVWDWLTFYAPAKEYGGWATTAIADAYGGDEAIENQARTGCVGCPLVESELALDTILRQPAWAYLAPLKELRPIWRWLREPQNRLKKRGVELLKDGSVGKNPQRMGPLTLEARARALHRVLAIQDECNAMAAVLNRPPVDIVNAEEIARIRELIARKTWPEKWEGDEPTGDTIMETVYQNGAVQPLLFP